MTKWSREDLEISFDATMTVIERGATGEHPRIKNLTEYHLLTLLLLAHLYLLKPSFKFFTGLGEAVEGILEDGNGAAVEEYAIVPANSPLHPNVAMDPD